MNFYEIPPLKFSSVYNMGINLLYGSLIVAKANLEMISSFRQST
jgi:hypothetical protein